jgi:hypothetical protein
LDYNKQKYIAVFLCLIFLDWRNQFPPPSHRLESDRVLWAKGNGRYIAKRKMGKTISETKNGTTVTKVEKWAKPSEKVIHRH